METNGVPSRIGVAAGTRARPHPKTIGAIKASPTFARPAKQIQGHASHCSAIGFPHNPAASPSPCQGPLIAVNGHLTRRRSQFFGRAPTLIRPPAYVLLISFLFALKSFPQCLNQRLACRLYGTSLAAYLKTKGGWQPAICKISSVATVRGSRVTSRGPVLVGSALNDVAVRSVKTFDTPGSTGAG